MFHVVSCKIVGLDLALLYFARSMYVCCALYMINKYYKHIIIIHVYIIIQVCHLQGDVLQKQKKFTNGAETSCQQSVSTHYGLLPCQQVQTWVDGHIHAVMTLRIELKWCV